MSQVLKFEQRRVSSAPKDKNHLTVKYWFTDYSDLVKALGDIRNQILDLENGEDNTKVDRKFKIKRRTFKVIENVQRTDLQDLYFERDYINKRLYYIENYGKVS